MPILDAGNVAAKQAGALFDVAWESFFPRAFRGGGHHNHCQDYFTEADGRQARSSVGSGSVFDYPTIRLNLQVGASGGLS